MRMKQRIVLGKNFQRNMLNSKLVSEEILNNFIINKWNKKITKEDIVFVFGVFAVGKIAKLKVLIPKFNGNIYLLSYKKENAIFKREQWKRLGIHSVWDCNLIYPITNGNIFIPSQKYNGKNKYDYKIVTEKDKQDTWYAMPEGASAVPMDPVTGKYDKNSKTLFYFLNGTEIPYLN